MAYTLDKGWKKQIESQMTTAIAFAENEEESFHIRALNEPMFSINDILVTKSNLAMSLFCLGDPEEDEEDRLHY